MGAQCEYFAGSHARRENRAKMPSAPAALQLGFEMLVIDLVNCVFVQHWSKRLVLKFPPLVQPAAQTGHSLPIDQSQKIQTQPSQPTTNLLVNHCKLIAFNWCKPLMNNHKICRQPLQAYFQFRNGRKTPPPSRRKVRINITRIQGASLLMK